MVCSISLNLPHDSLPLPLPLSPFSFCRCLPSPFISPISLSYPPPRPSPPPSFAPPPSPSPFLRYATWTIRLVEAVLAHCIPVLIADNTMASFGTLIDWDKVAVVVKEGDIRSLQSILNRVAANEKEVESKLQALLDIRSLFVYEGELGDANLPAASSPTFSTALPVPKAVKAEALATIVKMLGTKAHEMAAVAKTRDDASAAALASTDAMLIGLIGGGDGGVGIDDSEATRLEEKAREDLAARDWRTWRPAEAPPNAALHAAMFATDKSKGKGASKQNTKSGGGGEKGGKLGTGEEKKTTQDTGEKKNGHVSEQTAVSPVLPWPFGMTPTPPETVSHSDHGHNGDDNDEAKTTKTCINLACPIRARDLRRTVESSVLRFGEFHPSTLEMTMRWEGPVGIVALGETLTYMVLETLTNIIHPLALNVKLAYSSISSHDTNTDTSPNTVFGFYSHISLLVAFTPAEVKKALAVKEDLQKSHPSQMKRVTIRVVSLSTLDQATMRGTLRRIRRQAADRIARAVGERERWATEQLDDAAEGKLTLRMNAPTQCIYHTDDHTEQA